MPSVTHAKPSTRRQWSIVLTLVLAVLIATPGLVIAQSFSPGEDQMFTATDLCTVFDSRSWNDSQFGGDSKPQPSTNYQFAVRGPSADFSSQGGASDGCGVPTSADAVLLNLLSINPNGGGNMKAFAADVSTGDVAGTVINFNALSPNVNLNNAVVVPMDSDTSNSVDITVRPQGSATHVQGVVLGYHENVTDGFYTETQADALFARRSHDHELVQVDQGGGSQSIDASSTESVLTTDYAITDECLFGDNHNVLVRVNGQYQEGNDLNMDTFIEVNGTEQDASRQEFFDSSTNFKEESFALQQVVVLGSGTQTIAFRARNDDSDDSTVVADSVMTVEHFGWTCDPIIITGEDTRSDEEEELDEPDGSDRSNELIQRQPSDDDPGEDAGS